MTSSVDSQARDDENSGVLLTTLCDQCALRSVDNPFTCAAFPSGIPLVILSGDYDHHYPFEFGGLSDDGVVFVPKDD